MTVYYSTKEAKYFIYEEKKQVFFSSVTDMVNRHCFVMTEEILLKAAAKKARGTKKSVEDVLAAWKEEYEEAVDKGNAKHSELSGTIEDIRTPGNEIIEYTYKPLTELPDGEYKELRLFSSLYRVAARVDFARIRTENGIRYMDITEYKTGKMRDVRVAEETEDPYRMYGFMKSLPDSEVGKVIAQVSCYSYLAQLNGFTPGEMLLHHYIKTPDTPVSEILRYRETVIGGDSKHIYDVPFAGRETFMLFNENRFNHYEPKKVSQEVKQFTKIWD